MHSNRLCAEWPSHMVTDAAMHAAAPFPAPWPAAAADAAEAWVAQKSAAGA